MQERRCKLRQSSSGNSHVLAEICFAVPNWVEGHSSKIKHKGQQFLLFLSSLTFLFLRTKAEAKQQEGLPALVVHWICQQQQKQAQDILFRNSSIRTPHTFLLLWAADCAILNSVCEWRQCCPFVSFGLHSQARNNSCFFSIWNLEQRHQFSFSMGVQHGGCGSVKKSNGNFLLLQPWLNNSESRTLAPLHCVAFVVHHTSTWICFVAKQRRRLKTTGFLELD